MKKETKKYFKVLVNSITGEFYFVMLAYSPADLIEKAYGILPQGIKVKGEATKTTSKIVEGLKPYCTANNAYCIYF